MKLSFIGLCVAGTALAIILQTGAAAPVSSAFAAEEGCIVTEVAYHVRRCPPGVAFAVGGTTAVMWPSRRQRSSLRLRRRQRSNLRLRRRPPRLKAASKPM